MYFSFVHTLTQLILSPSRHIASRLEIVGNKVPSCLDQCVGVNASLPHFIVHIYYIEKPKGFTPKKERLCISLPLTLHLSLSLCMVQQCPDLLSAPFRTQVPHHINSHCYWIEQFLYQHHHIAVIMSLTFRNSVPTNDSCKVQNTIINLQDLQYQGI